MQISAAALAKGGNPKRGERYNGATSAPIAEAITLCGGSMYSDEFDDFVFHDAIERGGLNSRDACARVDQYGSWIHHAIVRLGYARGDAELRAAQQEIEQDIRNIQSRHGWGGQLMSAFQNRWQVARLRSVGSARALSAAGRSEFDSLNR